MLGPSMPDGMAAMMKRIVLSLVLALAALAVWLVAPFALWKAWGAWWMLLWLVPTTSVIFLLAANKPAAAGG